MRADAMVEKMARAVESLAPLRIDEVRYEDPSLTLIGVDWSLNVMCPWRIRRSGGLWTSCSEPDRADRIWDLIGHAIVGIVDRGEPVDPVFELTDAMQLEIFADTDTDPWALLLPGQTFVGTASVL